MDKTTIDLLELGTKARSKYELYQLLTSHCSLYLPPYKHCTVDFCADVIAGHKSALNCNKVIVKKIPQIKGLRTCDLLQFCVKNCEGQKYLPEKSDERPPDREWLGNIFIGNSLNPEGLGKLVDEILLKRREKILKEKNLSIVAPSWLANSIAASNFISRSKGRSNLLLNRSKRLARMEEEKKELPEQQDNEEVIKNLRQEIFHMEELLENAKIENEKAEENRAILSKLFEDKIIDDKGNLL